MPAEPHLRVDDVMRRWPATIRAFLDFGMRCVGCPIAGFHTVDDACREHGVDREVFLGSLRASAAAGARKRPDPGLLSREDPLPG
jgi:hybrid cluster-associated redox disulfide protein